MNRREERDERAYGKRRGSRVRSYWLLFVVLAVVAAVCAYAAVRWPGFEAKDVHVTGNTVVSSAEIIRAAAIDTHRNLWLQNSVAIERRVERIPYVNRAWLHRIFPASVTIDVRERTPFAVLQTPTQRSLVDRSLRVLEVDPPRVALPTLMLAKSGAMSPGSFVNDELAAKLRDDAVLLGAAHVAFARLAYDRFGEVVATRSDGIRLLLGDDEDLARKVALIDPILKQVARNRRVAAIDLRAVNTPVVVYK